MKRSSRCNTPIWMPDASAGVLMTSMIEPAEREQRRQKRMEEFTYTSELYLIALK